MRVAEQVLRREREAACAAETGGAERHEFSVRRPLPSVRFRSVPPGAECLSCARIPSPAAG
jgi:hypothetical protein